MNEVCPVCNGLTELLSNCPVCNSRMQDHGALTDYLGPYAAYEQTEMMVQHDHYCRHAAVCQQCGYRQDVDIPVLTVRA